VVGGVTAATDVAVGLGSQYTLATHNTGPNIIDGGTTTASIRPVALGSNYAPTTHMGPIIIDGGTTTASIRLVGLGSNYAPTAQIGTGIVDGHTTTASIGSKDLGSDYATTPTGSAVVSGRNVFASGPDDAIATAMATASATDVGAVVVDGGSATASTGTEQFQLQDTPAADVASSVVDVAAAAARERSVLAFMYAVSSRPRRCPCTQDDSSVI